MIFIAYILLLKKCTWGKTILYYENLLKQMWVIIRFLYFVYIFLVVQPN